MYLYFVNSDRLLFYMFILSSQSINPLCLMFSITLCSKFLAQLHMNQIFSFYYLQFLFFSFLFLGTLALYHLAVKYIWISRLYFGIHHCLHFGHGRMFLKIFFTASYLVPRVCPVWGVDEDGDDLGFGDQRCCSLGSFFWMEVISTLFK